MKNLTYAILVIMLIGLASCSSYTCPTYSSTPKVKSTEEARI